MFSTLSLTNRTRFLLGALALVLIVAGFSVAHRRTPVPIAVSSDHRRAWFLRKGQLMLITNEEGAALIQFTAERPSAAAYRWRFKSVGPGPEASGSGRVFEAYSKEPTGPNEVKVTDIGSRLAVNAGPFILEWSTGGTSGHYLYIDPGAMSARIVTGEFESFPLGPAA